LEYYNGIHFIATNRIGDFQEALQRESTQVYYPLFDDDETLKIFELNLNLIQQRFGNVTIQVWFTVKLALTSRPVQPKLPISSPKSRYPQPLAYGKYPRQSDQALS
jgi:hypothetical protein